MRQTHILLSIIILMFFYKHVSAQISTPALVGYWHNWDNGGADYIHLDEVDARFNIINVAFALPISGTTYDMRFVPDQVSSALFIKQVEKIQLQGCKVLISLGGANVMVKMSNEYQKRKFVASVLAILDTYHFDGVDIDLEGESVSVTGGSISTPPRYGTTAYLIAAIKEIMQQYQLRYNKKMILTMSPETAHITGGMSSYRGVWGAYLPLIYAFRDSVDLVHMQLYNSGTMYGIDGQIYSQGSADFILSQTEAIIQGFNTAGGRFEGLPPHKVAIGLPACSAAAGGGNVSNAMLTKAVNYLRGETDIKPGRYSRKATYPDLGGLMTWSINWDFIRGDKNVYEYADIFTELFPNILQSMEPSFVADAQRVITINTQIIDNHYIKLSWVLEFYQEGTNFQIERSVDGEQFMPIGAVAVGANDSGFFAFLDRHVTNNQVYYYRLKMTKKNNVIEYSATGLANIIDENKNITVYPNPTAANNNITVEANFEIQQINIINDIGQIIKWRKFDNGITKTNLPSNLPSGIYTVEVIANNHKIILSRLVIT
ncbi:MAG: glycosyl hydrolase family 18 protein [Saprospiraceae bacterium]